MSGFWSDLAAVKAWLAQDDDAMPPYHAIRRLAELARAAVEVDEATPDRLEAARRQLRAVLDMEAWR